MKLWYEIKRANNVFPFFSKIWYLFISIMFSSSDVPLFVHVMKSCFICKKKSSPQLLKKVEIDVIFYNNNFFLLRLLEESNVISFF